MAAPRNLTGVILVIIVLEAAVHRPVRAAELSINTLVMGCVVFPR